MNTEEIIKIEETFENIKGKKNSLEGAVYLINSQIKEKENIIEDTKKNKEIYLKAVQLLTIVQEETKEKMKKGFESIVSYALTYILSNTAYGLNLEFNKRGNLQELNLNLKTPQCQEAHNPLLSSGGGALDILSLALRVALLEVSKPKIEGFLALDEPFKHLSRDFLSKAGKFLRIINRKIDRQIIMVTHKEEFLDIADNNIKID